MKTQYLTFDLDPLHHVTYAPAIVEVATFLATSNGSDNMLFDLGAKITQKCSQVPNTFGR